MRPILLTLAFPLKVAHRLYGYTALALMLVSGAVAAFTVVLLGVVTLLALLGFGAVWFIVTLLMSVISTGMQHLIRVLDPKYMEGKKDVTKTALDAVAGNASRVLQ